MSKLSIAVTVLLALTLTAACRDQTSHGNGPDAQVPDSTGGTPDAAIDGPGGSIDARVYAIVDAPADSPGGGQSDAPIDSTTVVPDGIAAARASADGTGLALAIHGVTVTYEKPLIGNPANDPAGFTIQATRLGPALFVAVDPASLAPVPAVGDVVDFTITTKATVNGQPRAQAITGFTRTATGGNAGALAQDLSASTDVVTAADSYDSELVTVTGALAEAFSAAGTGFVRAAINTGGITGNPDLQLRVPAGVVDAIDMVPPCRFTATRVPMAHFVSAAQVSQAQIGAFATSDVALTGCPAPIIVAAVALSPTSLRLTFSRHIAPGSVMAGGAQFTIDHGLAVTAAAVSGRTVVLTTALQDDATIYGVTIAASVTDLQGSPIGGGATASFGGFAIAAMVRLNELNASIAGGCDLIELRVVGDGSMTGFTLTERTGNVALNELSFAFPSFHVHKDDLIVVHLNAASATCNPGGATQETTTPHDQPAAMFSANFDTAFDFYAADAGLVATDNVITLLDATGGILDAVFISNDRASTGTIAAGTRAGAALAGAANQWSPARTSYTDVEFRTAAADDLDATGTTVAGTSIQRIDDSDRNDRSDWTSGAGAAPTWGSLNANQHPLGTGGGGTGAGAMLSVHTTLGIPSPTSTMDPNSFLSVKSGYVVSYNSGRKVPNWVSWELNTTYLGSASRQDDYRPDDTLPFDLPQAQLSDYSGSGYDRGHMCPSADRTLTVAANSQTFFLTNMVPQAGNNNQGPWNDLENDLRTIARTGKELFVVSGGTFSATSNTVGNGMVVPDQTFKVIVVLDAVGQGPAAVTAATRVIAVLMPNENSEISKTADWHMFRVSVDMIEAMTGYDLLSDVDPAVQAIVEARVDTLP